MRVIDVSAISNAVKELSLKANIQLRKDMLFMLARVRDKEKNPKRKRILDVIVKNAFIAKRKKLPICQDTGMVVVYIKVGQDVKIKGDIKKAVEKGVREAYRIGYFRKSIVKDPLIRINSNTNLPPIIYMDIVPGNKIDIRVVIKGFGCENASVIKMFRPTDTEDAIEKFIIDSVQALGSKACPPMYIGIGIGGTLDKAVSLSKEATLRLVGRFNKNPHIARLEKRLLRKINGLKIGPMGMGGDFTALGVSVLTYPTHIAGLPVAINFSCHATRDARGKI